MAHVKVNHEDRLLHFIPDNVDTNELVDVNAVVSVIPIDDFMFEVILHSHSLYFTFDTTRNRDLAVEVIVRALTLRDNNAK